MDHAGKITHDEALQKSHKEYEKFCLKQLAEPTDVEKYFVEVEKEIKRVNAMNKGKTKL